MPDTAPQNDLREIWRSQPAESTEMKLGTQLLRQKARDLRSKNRGVLVNVAVMAVLIAAGSVYGSIQTDAPAARAVFAAAAAWVLIGQYFVHRTRRQAPLPEEAGLLTTLDSCRRELERQIRLHRDTLLWLVGPLLVALGAFIGTIARKGPLLKMAPFLTLLGVWALSMVVIRVRQTRDFQRAVEELDQIERESGVAPNGIE